MEIDNELERKRKLGTIVRINRIKHHITQSSLANMINCDQSVISRIEKGNEHINLSLYKLALKAFNMTHELDEDVEKDISDLGELVIKHYEYEHYEEIIKLSESIENCMNKCRNIISLYKLYVIEAIYFYAKSDFLECHYLLEELRTLIEVCDLKYQKIYTVLICHLSFNKHGHKMIKQTIEPFMKKYPKLSHHPLLNYWLGIYYFLTNKRIMCLKYLHAAYSNYRYKNHVKSAKIKTLIALLLIREHKEDKASTYFIDIIENESFETLPKRLKHTILSNLGYCYYKIESYDEAIKLFEKALEIRESYDYYFNYYFLLKIYEDINDQTRFTQTANIVNADVNPFDNNVNQMDSIDLKNKSISYYACCLYLKESKCDEYYANIESFILNGNRHFYDKPVRLPFLYELLNFYWQNKQYTKFRLLQNKMIQNYA